MEQSLEQKIKERAKHNDDGFIPSDKERLEIIYALAFVARERTSDAIMGLRDTDSALKEADLLLLATIYVKNYK